MTQVTLYVTHIDKEGPYLKIWGQTDRNLPIGIEKALQQMNPQFDQGQFLPTSEELKLGKLICARFKDGNYYRARITNTNFLHQGMIEVHFLDYGNKDFVQTVNTRTLTGSSASLISIPPQAKEFVLANVTHSGVSWEDNVFEIISSELRYLEFQLIPIFQIANCLVIKLFKSGEDISLNFINRGLVTSVPIETQQILLQNHLGYGRSPNVPSVQARQGTFTQNITEPQTTRSLTLTKMQEQPIASRPPPILTQPASPTLITYKAMPLEQESEHICYVSYVSDGPCLFSIQLKSFEDSLKMLMSEINEMKLQNLEETPLPGTVCLAKAMEDDLVCRAVVTNMVDSKFKVQ